MKKKILRLLVPILAIALLAAAIIGIQAMASEPTPYVMSKNVSYGSRVYLYYAVPVDSVPDGHEVKLGFYSSATDETANYYVLPEEKTQNVYGTPCYVFQSYGVSAKNLNTKQYVRPVSFVGETASKVGEIVSYSVEDYVYERLYGNGFALMNDGDGKNYERRNLYYDLLWYGRSAQDLLDKSNPDHIGESIDYLGALFSVGGVSGNSVTLDFDESLLTTDKTPAYARYHKGAIGYYELDAFGDALDYVEFTSDLWTVTHYDVFGNVTREYTVADGATVEAGEGSGVIIARPNLSFRSDLGANKSALKRGDKIHIVTNGFVELSDLRALVSTLEHAVGSAGAVTTSTIAYSQDADLTIEFDYFSDSALRAGPTTKDNPTKAEGTSIFENARYSVSSSEGKITVLCDQNPYTPLNSSTVAIDTLTDLLEPALGIVCFTNGDNGEVFSGEVNLIEMQRAIDIQEIDARWAALETKLGDKDLVRELRQFFEGMTNETIVRWSGSLYDPATGLFYSSHSGKNTEGYYPHPEATSQNTSFPMNSGMMRTLGGTIILPEMTKYKIIYYLKSIQDPNGSFYVAQMEKSTIATERVGRDRSACITMLSRCGGKPTYSNGTTKGDGITAEQYWQGLVDAGLVTEDDKPIIYWHQNNEQAAEPVTASLTRSAVMAVSKVIAVSDEEGGAADSGSSSSGVKQFQSPKAFIEWLISKDPYNNPYSAISNTSSAASFIDTYSNNNDGDNSYTPPYSLDQMKTDWGESAVKTDENDKKYVEIYGMAKGVTSAGGTDKNATPFRVYENDTLLNILISWLNSYINEAGLFGKVSNNYDDNGDPVYDGYFGGWGYQNSNGMLKCIGRYTTAGVAFPKPWEAADSLLKGICNPEQPSGNILVMYNVWSSLSSLKKNIKECYTGADKQDLLNFIENTLSSTTNYVTGEPIISEDTGEPMSYVAYAVEVNLDKSLIFRKSDGGFAHNVNSGTGTWQGGLPVGVPGDNLSDTDGTFCGVTSLGSSICGVLGISISTEVPIHTESDFMIWMDSLLEQPYVIKKTPTERAAEAAANRVELDTFEEAEDADVQKYFESGLSANGNTATVVEKNGSNVLFLDKSTATAVSLKTAPMRQDKNAKLFTFSFDMLIENAPSGISNEVYLWSGGTKAYYIHVYTSGSTIYLKENGTGSAISTGVTIGSWAHFEFVYSEDTASYDVLVNGTKLLTGTTLRDVTEAPKVSSLTAASMWYGGSRIMDCYIDNLSVTKTVGKIDFDDNTIPSAVTGSSASTTHTLVDRGDGNMALRVNKPSSQLSGGALEVSLTERSDLNANTLVFECDMNVTSFAQMAIYITNPEVGTGSNNLYYTNIYSSNVAALTYGDATAPIGEWVHFRLEYSKTATGGRTSIIITRADGTVAKQTYFMTDTIDFSEANMIVFHCQQKTIHDVLYDNIVCKKTYVDRTTITFDEEVGTDLLATNDNGADVGDTIGVVESFEGKTNVLKFHKAYGKHPDTNSSINMGITMKTTETQENANCVIVDLDLYAPSNGMELYLMNGSSSVYTYIVLGSNVTVPKNQWVHVKIEYYPATDTETLKINVTVTDNAGKTYTCASTSTRETAPTVDALSAVKISLNSSAVGDYYFDNIKVSKAYVAADETN